MWDFAAFRRPYCAFEMKNSNDSVCQLIIHLILECPFVFITVCVAGTVVPQCLRYYLGMLYSVSASIVSIDLSITVKFLNCYAVWKTNFTIKSVSPIYHHVITYLSLVLVFDVTWSQSIILFVSVGYIQYLQMSKFVIRSDGEADLLLLKV